MIQLNTIWNAAVTAAPVKPSGGDTVDRVGAVTRGGSSADQTVKAAKIRLSWFSRGGNQLSVS